MLENRCPSLWTGKHARHDFLFPQMNLSTNNLDSERFAKVLTRNFHVPNANQDVPSWTRCGGGLMAIYDQVSVGRLAVKSLAGSVEQIGGFRPASQKRVKMSCFAIVGEARLCESQQQEVRR